MLALSLTLHVTSGRRAGDTWRTHIDSFSLHSPALGLEVMQEIIVENVEMEEWETWVCVSRRLHALVSCL